MDNQTIILSIVSVIFMCSTILLLFNKFKKHNEKDKKTLKIINEDQNDHELNSNIDPEENSRFEENGYEFKLVDENGLTLLESKEISEIPRTSCRLRSSDNTLNRVTHLTSDLFKGAVGIPNKTVKIVFSPEIQKGLSDGTYKLMQTKTKEVLADAIDNSTKKIVGKGRIIQGGKVRQLASGAFQLASIAVAQSHLADIERSLGAIKDSISEVLSRLENEDKARITGAFDYLNEIALDIKNHRSPEEISQQKKNAIELVIKDSYAWRNKLHADISSLTEQIRNIKDLDTFGTGDTYEKLKELIGKIDPLLKRHELLLNLAAATNFMTAYLDPTQRQFSKINPESQKWASHIEQFRSTAINRASTSLTKAIFNSSETLSLRNEHVKSLSSQFFQTAITQQKQHDILIVALDNSIKNIIQSDGRLSIAVKFDEHGEVHETAIVS